MAIQNVVEKARRAGILSLIFAQLLVYPQPFAQYVVALIMSILIRKPIVGPFVLLLAIAILYPICWFYAAARMETQFSLWVENLRARGFAITYGPASTSGFPGVVRFSVDKPNFRSPDGHWAWRGNIVHLGMQPWDWWRYRLEFSGPQQFKLSHPILKQRIQMTPKSVVVVLRVHTNGRLAEGEVTFRSTSVMNADKTLMLSTEDMWFKVTQPEKRAYIAEQTAVSVAVSIDNLLLPAAAKSPLGGRLAKIQFVADLKGPLPKDMTRQGFDEWRQTGGLIDASWLNLVWGSFDLRGRGSVSIDKTIRPVGSMTADIRGYSETMDALEDAGIMTGTGAAAIRMGMSVLAKPSPVDGADVLTVPLTTRSGYLHAGPFQILKLPQLILPSR